MGLPLTESICMIKGSTETLRLTVFDDSSVPIDLTGSTVYFTVALTAGGAAEITKTSATPSEILLLAQTGATLGQADIFIVPGDTSALPLGLHKYDIWVQLSGGERKVVVNPTDFRLEAGVTVIP